MIFASTRNRYFGKESGDLIQRSRSLFQFEHKFSMIANPNLFLYYRSKIAPDFSQSESKSRSVDVFGFVDFIARGGQAVLSVMVINPQIRRDLNRVFVDQDHLRFQNGSDIDDNGTDSVNVFEQADRDLSIDLEKNRVMMVGSHVRLYVRSWSVIKLQLFEE